MMWRSWRIAEGDRTGAAEGGASPVRTEFRSNGGGRLKETDGALGGGVGSGRRHPFDFGVRVYGVM